MTAPHITSTAMTGVTMFLAGAHGLLLRGGDEGINLLLVPREARMMAEELAEPEPEQLRLQRAR